VNGKYGWHAAAAELAEAVRTAGPRVTAVGEVMVVLVAAPVLLRAWFFVPW
jgi:hypothetical protein